MPDRPPPPEASPRPPRQESRSEALSDPRAALRPAAEPGERMAARTPERVEPENSAAERAADKAAERPIDLGIYGRLPEPRISSTEIIAGALTGIWLVAVVAFFLLAGGGGAEGVPHVLTLVAVFMPIALIWVAASTARTMRAMRAEAARLQATVDAMRQAYLAQTQAAAMGLRPAVERKLDEIAATQRQQEAAIASMALRREAPLSARAGESGVDRGASVTSGPRPRPVAAAVAGDDEDQPALALGTPTEALRTPLPRRDFIRALNFPEGPEDRDGFRALRAALEDRDTAKLIRAAQDVLTLLGQDGIYMDDLKPDRARPEFWRKFAAGERGRAIGALGGVRDRSCLALTAGRMRQDPVFRDAAHHFLRQFDRSFAGFEKTASDADVTEFAATRTARAFMLLGRVTGTFD